MSYRVADPNLLGDPIAREIERIRRIRWLDPDLELHELEPAAMDWLDLTAKEHARLVARHLPSTSRLCPRVVVTRGMEETCERFDEACLFETTVETLERLVEQRGATGALRTEVESAVRESQQRSQPWARTLEPLWTTARPGLATALAHVGWVAREGTTDSPWSALMSCWERGAYPLALPEGGLLVYVPVVAQRALVADPRNPAAPPRVERRSVYVDRTDLDWPSDPFEIYVEDLPDLGPEGAGYGPLPRIVQRVTVEWPPRSEAPRVVRQRQSLLARGVAALRKCLRRWWRPARS
ncbi:MAG: hypothetical protein IT379_42100 [Deltaproteobacteria bacterium]|nr:hypothetical protein [Deltaproteobacteria bacterium]